jgi:hypothetical protein
MRCTVVAETICPICLTCSQCFCRTFVCFNSNKMGICIIH